MALTGQAAAQGSAAGDAAQLPQRKSSLPREALLQARDAEQHLTANAPEKALEILHELDRQYPGQTALSLRLAEIYDTMGKHAHALFFYRRYVALAGDRARPLAIERVASLELMAGVAEQVEKKIEPEFGEDTRPVTTPTPKVERMLMTRAQDGGLVPIRNEQDLQKLEREGVPMRSPQTPVPTMAITPIILPDQTNRPAAARSQDRTPAAARQQPRRAVQSELVAEPVSSISLPAASTQQAEDEDALLAQAFRKADDAPVDNGEADTEQEPMQVSAADLAPMVSGELTPLPRLTPRSRSGSTVVSDADGGQNNGGSAATATPSTAGRRNQPEAQRPAPASDRQVIYTSPTPEYTSPRAAGFFNITPVQGQLALVSLVNDMPMAVVTLTITPRDDGEMMSAILVTGEQKRVYVRPGTYDVMANVSTTDYSPITLMNTNFEYTFSGGQQYTRRFNKNNIQQLN